METRGERVLSIDATYGGTRGQAVLHHVQALAGVGVEVLGRADLFVLHDAVGLEEAVARVFVAGSILGSGEQDLAVVGRREVPAWGGGINTTVKLKSREEKRTNIDLVALERVPADLFLIEFD